MGIISELPHIYGMMTGYPAAANPRTALSIGTYGDALRKMVIVYSVSPEQAHELWASALTREEQSALLQFGCWVSFSCGGSQHIECARGRLLTKTLTIHHPSLYERAYNVALAGSLLGLHQHLEEIEAAHRTLLLNHPLGAAIYRLKEGILTACRLIGQSDSFHRTSPLLHRLNLLDQYAHLNTVAMPLLYERRDVVAVSPHKDKAPWLPLHKAAKKAVSVNDTLVQATNGLVMLNRYWLDPSLGTHHPDGFWVRVMDYACPGWLDLD